MIRLRSHLISASALATLAMASAVGATALAAEPVVVVEPGDTLSDLALRHGVEVADLVAINGIENPNRIFAGQRLRLAAQPAAPAAQPAAAPASRTHVVASGENLTWIARRYGVSVASIVAANGITDASRIFAGQRLSIPAAGGAAPAATTPAPAMPSDMAAAVAARDAVRQLITSEAQRFEVPVALALAVAWQESGWQQGVESHAGAIGIMQVLPATGEWVGAAMLRAPVDLRDAGSNVRTGVRLLAHYLDRYDGNRELVLAAYYQGQRATDLHGVYPISRAYIASILNLERSFAG